MSTDSTRKDFLWTHQAQSAMAENLVLRRALNKIFETCCDDAIPASLIPDMVCDLIHDALNESERMD